jgi:hypothetical protein
MVDERTVESENFASMRPRRARLGMVHDVFRMT